MYTLDSAMVLFLSRVAPHPVKGKGPHMEYTERTIQKMDTKKDKGFHIVRYTTAHTRETLATVTFLFRVRLTLGALITLFSYCETPLSSSRIQTFPWP